MAARYDLRTGLARHVRRYNSISAGQFDRGDSVAAAHR